MKNTILVFTLLCASLLFGQTATAPAAGNGSSGNPYQIATLDNLYWIAYQQDNAGTNFSGTYFIQTANIDASSTSTWFSGTGWLPIGNYSSAFPGNYNGQGYTITGLFINRVVSTYMVGLFGYCTGAISNLGLINVNVTGGNTGAGGLAGGASSVSKCYSTGTVSGTQYVGGLVGETTNNISQSYSTCTVTAASAGGGLSGDNSGTITNCYSLGNISSASDNGGLVGWNSGTISYCYSTGSVSGRTTNGLVGSDMPGSYTSNFFDETTSGQTSGNSTNSNTATPEVTANMQTQSTFTGASPAWDFTNTWEITGTNYPNLKNNLNSALPVELTTFTAIVSGNEIELNWNTATEVNDYGFEVEKLVSDNWQDIAFVKGSGTSNSPKSYSFMDDNPLSGKAEYRLKQIDNDGNFKYSQDVTVNSLPAKFELLQNYPNPFNPTTTIQYAIPKAGHVALKVYDEIGREVASLVDEKKEAGQYNVTFNASNFASGIYFYRITAGDFTEVKKLMLLK